MQLNHIIVALCLLGTVALCRGNSTPLPPDATSPPHATSLPHATSPPKATSPRPLSTHKPDATSQPATGPTAHSDTTVPIGSTNSTNAPEEGGSPEGLSAGAIAGITIGSIGGVAAVGGGIFGLLKYTGKI